MTRAWMAMIWLATTVPLVALLGGTLCSMAERWKRSTGFSKASLAILWLAGAAFLLSRPHDDSFTGLDNMTYRHLAHAFANGRGFHDPDAVLGEVPPELRENFLLHRGPVGRPTRDRVFSLSGWQSVETKPFFMPTLPLAAAWQAPVLEPARFVPLVGALWWGIVLAAGFRAGGGRGLAAALALALGTAWPAYFLRGFYAEGVGAMLVGAVVATVSARPLRGGMAAAAGFALGLSVGYHPTMVALAVPAGLALMLERREGRTFVAVALGMAAGLVPFWALTRWVCQPYGDWTRWSKLARLVFLAPEHMAIALVVAVLAAFSGAALWAGFRPRMRAWVREVDGRMVPWGWLAACALPLALAGFSPDWADGALGKGAAAAWSGIRWPCAILFAAAGAAALRTRRPIRERYLLASLCWIALLHLFIQGVETPVGLWSQRRFLPVAIVGISLLAAPAAAGWAGATGRGWALGLAALAAVGGGANLARWPLPYGLVNEQGAAEWVDEVAAEMGTERLVVFDYYGHSVPYAANLQRRVLGLGEPSRERWPEVAEWIAEIARTGEVWVATSWEPCALEEGFMLEEALDKSGSFPMANTKGFFPAKRGTREVRNRFMRVVPLGDGMAPAQEKTFDGGPIGLRGPWGGMRRGGAWTRQGSGLVGPIPVKGGRAVFEAEGEWNPPDEQWTGQWLTVAPPWGGDPLRVEATEGSWRVRGELFRPEGDGDRPPAGVYRFAVERPYDPEMQGLKGYASDLGVLMRKAIIRIEPDR